uniref:Uncharacterized protein n=1 Tax=Oryza nivara TaxID=4536 RepID=A0A0E0G590_ORYNI
MLMLHVAELVPKHLGRTRKQEPATSSSAANTVKSTKGRRKKRLHHQILGLRTVIAGLSYFESYELEVVATTLSRLVGWHEAAPQWHDFFEKIAMSI